MHAYDYWVRSPFCFALDYHERKNVLIEMNPTLAEEKPTPQPYTEMHAAHLSACLVSALNGRCYCGVDDEKYNKHGSEICDVPCSGDSSLVCGGIDASNVFSIY